MAALTGNTVASTYTDLLQVSNSGSGVDGTLRNVSDGEGTDSVLQVSTTAVNIDGTFTVGGSAVGADSIPNGGYVTGRLYDGYMGQHDATNEALVVNTLYTVPFIVAETNTFDRFSFEVGVTGTATSARVGIYNMSGGIPTTLLLDCGTAAVNSTGQKDVTISQSIDAGVYGVTIVTNGTVSVYGFDGTKTHQPAHSIGYDLVGSGAFGCYTASHTFGALPATHGTPTANNLRYPLMMLRSA